MAFLTAYLDSPTLIKAYVDKSFSYAALEHIKIFKGYEEINKRIINLEDYGHSYKITYEVEAIDFRLSYLLTLNEMSTRVIYRHIQASLPLPDLSTLGPQYSKEKTIFRILAFDAIKVKLFDLRNNMAINMPKVEENVYELEIKGDLEGFEYYYLIQRYESTIKCPDPFAYGGGPNNAYSIVLDPDKFIKERYPLKHQSAVDCIIYELSVRDFTSSHTSNVKNKGKFIGLIEKGHSYNGQATGFDYLKELGITHVQLMPVMDFGSVDELEPQKSYNWGYDPVAYNLCEGSYVSDLKDPYKRVNDLRELVNTFHKNKLKVNLDVVFNHVYKWKEFSLNKLCPYGVYRYKNDEELSDGSFCGNEIKSESPLMRAYIKLMCLRYVNLFDIDGMRFDLMGLIDADTMNELIKELRALKSDFMVYGEGWDMPTPLDFYKRSTIANRQNLSTNIAFFNPEFRDVIKGATSDDYIKEKGYVLGNLALKEEVKKLLSGHIYESDKRSINYVECHDNHTFFDKMVLSGVDKSEYKGRAKLALALTLLAKGIPFIHSGQEFMRTKHLKGNTYNSGDFDNQIDYALRNQNADLVDYFKDLVKIRKEYHNYFDLEASFEDYYEVLIYKLGDLWIFINACVYEHIYPLFKARLIFLDRRYKEEEIREQLVIPPLSIAIVKMS